MEKNFITEENEKKWEEWKTVPNRLSTETEQIYTTSPLCPKQLEKEFGFEKDDIANYNYFVVKRDLCEKVTINKLLMEKITLMEENASLLKIKIIDLNVEIKNLQKFVKILHDAGKIPQTMMVPDVSGNK